MKLDLLIIGFFGCLTFAACSAKEPVKPASAAAAGIENEKNLELVSRRLCEAINLNRQKDVASFFDLKEWRSRVLEDLAGASGFSTSRVPLREVFEKNPQLEVAQLLDSGTAFLEKALLMIPRGLPWSDGIPSLERQLRASDAFPPVGGFLEFLGMRPDPLDGVHPVFRWIKAGELRFFELIPARGWKTRAVEDIQFADALDWADETTASELARGVVILLNETSQSTLTGRWERDLFDSPEAGFLMVPFNRGTSFIPPGAFPNLETMAMTVKSRPIFMINAATMSERSSALRTRGDELPSDLSKISTEMAVAWQKAAPDSPAVLLRTLHLWNAANQYDEWIELDRRIVLRGIADPMVEYAIAVGLLNAGRDREALARLETGRSKFPDDPSLLWLRFRLAAGAGQYAQAAQMWQRLGELSPGMAGTGDELLDDPWFHPFLKSPEGRHLAASPGSRELSPDEAADVRTWVESVLRAVDSGPPEALLPFVDMAALRRGLLPMDKRFGPDLFETYPLLEQNLRNQLAWITQSLKPAFMHSAVMDRGRISVVIRRGQPEAPAHHGWLVDNMEWRLNTSKPHKIRGICQAGSLPPEFGLPVGAVGLGRPGMINFFPQSPSYQRFDRNLSSFPKPVPPGLLAVVWPWFHRDGEAGLTELARNGWQNVYAIVCARPRTAAFLNTTSEAELEEQLSAVIARTGDEAFADTARLIQHIIKGRKEEALTLTSKMLAGRTINQPLMGSVFPLLAEFQQWEVAAKLADLFLTPPAGYNPSQVREKLSETASRIDESMSSEKWTPFFGTEQGRALVIRLRQLMAAAPKPPNAAESGLNLPRKP